VYTRTVLAIAVLSTALVLGAPDSDAAASAVVRDFYTAYLTAHRPAGLPTGEALKTLGPFLSARLRLLIMEASEYSARQQRQHPDEKPPFVDGDYFSSNFEGASRFEVARAERKHPGYRVVVQFEYEDPTSPKDVVRWEDAILLVESGGGWAIDDVEYHAPWPFANHGRLSEALRAR
jgi:hypothetical protein